jgi:hypothetical protein
MQMLYNSDSYIVVEFDVPGVAESEAPSIGRGGYEIVDKFARKEIFLEGLMAEEFKTGVQAIADNGPSPEAFDEFIGRFTVLAQQPVVMH